MTPAAATTAPPRAVLCSRGVALPRDEVPEDVLSSLFCVSKRARGHDGRVRTVRVPIWCAGPQFVYLPRHSGLEYVRHQVSRDALPAPPGPPAPSAPALEFRGSLRPHQEAAARAFLATERRHPGGGRTRGGVVVLPCGFGKTALGIYLATEASAEGGCLVVVHKSFLGKQWEDAIAKFAPEATVTHLGGRARRAGGGGGARAHFTIATVQTLTGARARELREEIARTCVMAIFDEVHHLSADVFSRAVTEGTVACRYRLGLTATPDRSDGTQGIFFAHLGPAVYQATRCQHGDGPELGRDRADAITSGTLDRPGRGVQGVVQWVTTGKSCPVQPVYRTVAGRRTRDFVSTMTRLVGHEPRDRVVVTHVTASFDAGRKILVLSERRAHLERLLAKISDARPVARIGLYVGGTKQAELDRVAATCDIMLCTVSMAAEGLDCPRMDTLVFATPATASIEQCVGRVQRRAHACLVIDIVDECMAHRSSARRRVYESLGLRGVNSGAHAAREQPAPRFVDDDDDDNDDDDDGDDGGHGDA